jgi:hypothetical protein
MFTPGKPFQPNLTFVRKPGAYPIVENLKGASLGQAQALLSSIIVSLKALPRTNTRANYKHV